MIRDGTKVPVTNLRTLLRSLVLNTEGEEVTVGELLHAVGRRAHGPIFMLLGFIAISPLTLLPGTNWLMATVILIFALQVVLGLRHPWLPRRVLDFTFRREHLVQGVAATEKYAHMVDALVKPRLPFLTEAPFIQLAALVCILSALATYPLGLVPFGPLLPSLTVLLFGLALTARDGVVLLMAFGAFAAAILLTIQLIPRLAALWPF
ncbi:MAG: exopolysaccharide biosynthesis protein [Hyphomonas sp.]